ncbi:MAG: ABC transporter permease [Actinobacteria bacterium]|nr:ABC transporter permease [Actinomycetota bacterium]
MSIFFHQVRSEQLVFWRSREAAIFIFIFPLMLFLLLGSVYDGTAGVGGVEYPVADVLLAGLIGYGAANTAFAGLAITLVLRREEGLLKRLRATPLPAATYGAAVLASTLAVFLLQAVLLIVLGRVLYGATVPERPGSLLAAVVIGALAFAGMGVGTAALIRSAEGASAVVNVIVLPMAFLSGSFGPTDLPQPLAAIADVLPLTHLLDVLNAITLEDAHVWNELGSLAVVVAWGVAGLAVAVRRFGWEPRER